jgi:hypothetical protein
MLERRHPLRRGLCGGLVVGALAGIASGLTSTLLLGGGELLRVAADLAPLHALAGLAVGAAVGLAQAAAEPAVERMARRRSNLPRAAATLYTLGATPLVAAVGARATSGIEPSWAAPAVGAGALAVLFLILWMCLRIAHAIDWRARRGEGEMGPAAATSIGLLLLAVAARALSDAPTRGTSLALAVTAAGLGLWMGSVYWASRVAKASERRWGRLAAPRSALALAVVVVTAATWSLSDLGKPESGARRERLRDGDALVRVWLD